MGKRSVGSVIWKVARGAGLPCWLVLTACGASLAPPGTPPPGHAEGAPTAEDPAYASGDPSANHAATPAHSTSTGGATPATPTSGAAKGASLRIPSLAETQRASVQRFVATMASGDGAELAALYALDAKLLSTASTAGGPDGQAIVGRDAIVGHYAGLLSSIDQRKASLHRIFQRGTFVAAEWTLQGALASKGARLGGPGQPGAQGESGTRGSKKGKAAKNAEVGATLLSLFWIGEDGLVREQHDTLDASTLSDKGSKAVAAAERPKIYVARGEAMERDNLDTVRNLLLALDSDPKGDDTPDARAAGKSKARDGFPSETLSDEVERQDVALRRTHKGKAKVREAYRRDARELSARSTQVLHSMAVQDFVVVETRTVGTATARTAGKSAKAPTTVAQRAVEIYELRDGKVAKVWRFAGPFAADPARPAASGEK